VTRLALASAFLMAATAAYAQQPDAPSAPSAEPQAQVFRSGASLVALNVTVTDGARKLITGLKADEFEVFEDGVLQRVQFFESSQVPIDLMLLIDASASMRDKMATVHEAALGFLKTLRPGDRGAVITFSDGVNVIQPLTGDHAALASAIRGTRAEGATALHNALYVTLKEFGRQAQQSGDVRRQAIAVLSDGEDTSSLVTFDDVLGLARRTGVSIYTIRLQSQFGMARAMSDNKRYFSDSAYAMKTLAQETGGQSYFPDAVSELKNVYGTIADELSAQYSLGYTPSNGRRDGRFRRIVVRVASHPEFKSRTRNGYTADADRTAAHLNADKR
jgi:Ca-activated chloride channel homolog